MHIPFCESLCYYCACNKIITKHHDRAAAYLDDLEREIDLHAADARQRPGGRRSCTSAAARRPSCRDAELARADGQRCAAPSRIAPDAEISIEVDPRTVDAGAAASTCAALGFNRLSFGVQDFDPEVQKAVHRIQPFEQVRALMDAARARIGFGSINIDLIYGLPQQTPGELRAHARRRSRALRPDRIALYAYAHLPERFKPQRRIDRRRAAGRRRSAGDARPRRSRASATPATSTSAWTTSRCPTTRSPSPSAQGRLHRNFQGYSTQPDCDLVGLGVSAIGTVGATYSQNAKTLRRVLRRACDAGPAAGRARPRAERATTCCGAT